VVPSLFSLDAGGETPNMDPASLKDAIIPRTKSIIPADLFSQMADSAIEKAAKLPKVLSLTTDAVSRFREKFRPTFYPILFGSFVLLFLARSPWVWFD
jgi:hypothetical protein